MLQALWAEWETPGTWRMRLSFLLRMRPSTSPVSAFRWMAAKVVGADKPRNTGLQHGHCVLYQLKGFNPISASGTSRALNAGRLTPGLSDTAVLRDGTSTGMARVAAFAAHGSNSLKADSLPCASFTLSAVSRCNIARAGTWSYSMNSSIEVRLPAPRTTDLTPHEIKTAVATSPAHLPSRIGRL